MQLSVLCVLDTPTIVLHHSIKIIICTEESIMLLCSFPSVNSVTLHFTICSFLRSQKLLAPRPAFKLIVFLGTDWHFDYDYCLLNGYNFVLSGSNVPTFQNNVPPLYSGSVIFFKWGIHVVFSIINKMYMFLVQHKLSGCVGLKTLIHFIKTLWD
jgi:hypothetical protein